MRKSYLEVIVGFFIIAGIAALAALAFKVSGLAQWDAGNTYSITAEFDNIGGLKTRAPVSIGGVIIGQVGGVTLDPVTFRAKVILLINKKTNDLPKDTEASILTQGLLGANYVSLTPGFDNEVLKNGDTIETTHSALILENLIGQLLFSFKDGGEKENKTAAAMTTTPTTGK